MPRTNADLLAIKAELTDNPEGLPYAAHTAENEQANTDALNLVRSALQVDREAIPQSEISSQVNRDDYRLLDKEDQDLLDFYSSGDSVNPVTGGEVRSSLLVMFPNASTTRDNLLAILTEDANRINHLFKAGTLSVGGMVTTSDVARARTAV